jgi:peptidoglycan-associated lipoprotein
MRHFLYLAPMLLAAACASHEPNNEVPVTERSSTVAPVASSASSSTARPAAQTVATGNPLHDPNGILAKRSIYFDYDSNVVKAEYQPLIQAHSSFMTSHAESRARIEGNCDERGSREYNLALGQRRAEGVKRVMVALGVPDSHVETVSFGEEKPSAAGHDEASWASNRRDDVRYVVE